MEEGDILNSLLQRSSLTSVDNQLLLQPGERISLSLENPFLCSSSTQNRLLTSYLPSTRSSFLSGLIHQSCDNELSPEPERKANEDKELSNEEKECSVEDKESILEDESVMEVEEERESFPDFLGVKRRDPFVQGSISVGKQDPLQIIKIELLQTASTALLARAKLMDPQDAVRVKIIDLCNQVLDKDFLFILKLALYCRREMGLRDASLLLLSFACLHAHLYAPHFCAYFQKCIMTPGEWISMTEFLATFERENKTSLPAMLRRAMVKRFENFDEYQLAKYQSKGRSKKSKKPKEAEKNEEMEDDPYPLESRAFNIKRLIRLLHIKQPSAFVVALLGKKYPKSEEEFTKANPIRGGQKFDPAKAGKRLRLKIPQTWEAQVSIHGNKPEVWHRLILDKKIPYLALIRNLRNIILSGINEDQLEDVIASIKCKSFISSSKVFPFQYLSAFGALEKFNNGTMNKIREIHKRKKNKNHDNKRVVSEREFAERLCKALEEAMLYSFTRSMASIEGQTLIFVVNPYGNSSSFELGAYSTICYFAALIIAQASKSSKILICGSLGIVHKRNRDLDEKLISSGINYFNLMSGCDEGIPKLSNYLIGSVGKVHIDNLIILFQDPPKEKLENITQFVEFMDYYRSLSSSETNLTMLTITGAFPPSLPLRENSRNMFISGFSESTLKSLSKFGHGSSQLCEIEGIDAKYNIPSKVPLALPVQRPLKKVKWTRVKIFVSSTFWDMFGERNLLNHCVFPVLKRRCRDICVEVTPIDLRWGLPEDPLQELSSTKYCLERVQESDLFICFIGERYGWKPKHSPAIEKYFLKDSEALKTRLKNNSISMTELEIRLRNWRRAHFYIRDPCVLNMLDVPDGFYNSQTSEDDNALKALKEDILASRCSVYQNYRAKSITTRNAKTAFANFEEDFIRTIIERLWEEILELKSKEPTESADSMLSYISKESEGFIGRDGDIQDMKNIILSDSNEFKIIEVQGNGKSSFLCKMTSMLSDIPKVITIPFFSDGVGHSFCVMEYLEDQILQLFSKSKDALDKELSGSESSLSFVRVAKLISEIQVIGKIVVFVLDNPPQDCTSWLPYSKFPPGVRIIVSTNSPDSIIGKHLSARRSKYKFDRLFKLDIIKDVSLKKYLVTQFLEKMGGKVLSEAPLNNVLRLIASKKESGNVKYLEAVCAMLVSSDEIVSGQESTMIQKEMPGNLQSLYKFILDREDEDSGILLAVLTVLIQVEGPTFDQLLAASEHLHGKAIAPMCLLRTLNRLEGFMNPSLKRGYFLKESLKSVIKKKVPEAEEYRHQLYDHFCEQFDHDIYDCNLVHPYILKSVIKLCLDLQWTAYMQKSIFIDHCARHGPELMEFFYFRCAQSIQWDGCFLSFLHLYSESLVNNPNLAYQHVLNHGLAEDMFDTGASELAPNESKDESFLFLENVNKSKTRKLFYSAVWASFSTLKVLCAATQEDIWAFGSVDCIIVQLQDSTMFGLYVHSPVTSLCFAEKDVLIAGLKDGAVSFWDIKKRSPIAHHTKAHFKAVSSLFLTPFSKNIVSTGLDGNVVLYSSSFGSYQVTNRIPHFSPISSGIPINESTITFGNWAGEIIKFNISSESILERRFLSKGAVLDLSVITRVNNSRLFASTDDQGYFYLFDEDLTLLKCRTISRVHNVLGNKVKLISETELLLACSDGCVRKVAFNSFCSNFYENMEDLVEHPFRIGSHKHKSPDFRSELVVCMDSYKSKRIIGYDSGWVRIFDERSGSSHSIKMIENKGELSQVLVFGGNVFILVTNTNCFISFRFDDKQIYDVRKVLSLEIEYLDCIVPISREKGTFMYPRKNCKMEFYQIPHEPLNKVKKRARIDDEVKTLKPEFVSDIITDYEEPELYAVHYKNNMITVHYNEGMSLWKYSEKDHQMEKVKEYTTYEQDHDVYIVFNEQNTKVRVFSSPLEKDPKVLEFVLNRPDSYPKYNDLTLFYPLNAVDENELTFYMKGPFNKYLSRGELFHILRDPTAKIQYRRNGKLIVLQDDEGVIILKEAINHAEVKLHDLSVDNTLLSLSLSELVYIDAELNVCSSNARIESFLDEEPLLEKRRISSILPLQGGGDDRDWIIVSGTSAQLYSLSNFDQPGAKRSFLLANEIEEFVVNSVWRSGDALIFSCFSRSELFSIIVDSSGVAKRETFWVNHKSHYQSWYNSDSDDDCSSSGESRSMSRTSSLSSDEGKKGSMKSSISPISSKNRRASRKLSDSSSSDSEKGSRKSSISPSGSKCKRASRKMSTSSSSGDNSSTKKAHNSLIGVDWSSGYDSGFATLGFADGSVHKVNIANSEELDNIPLKREIYSIHHFFHPQLETLKVNSKTLSTHVRMSGEVNIFGSLDGRILVQDSALDVTQCVAHKEVVTALVKVNENTFASVSKDKYCKIWKLCEGNKVQQIGEFLSEVPLLAGGFSTYTKTIILGGDFGVVHFLKVKKVTTLS